MIVNYHMVSDLQLPYIQNLYHYRDVKTFLRDLELYRKSYCPIGMPEFLASLKGETILPENALMVTFDDGFREIVETAAPLLLAREIPATLFITRDFVDNKALNHDNKQSMVVERLKSHVSRRIKQDILDLVKQNSLPGDDLLEIVLKIPYNKRSLVDQIASMLDIDFAEFLAVQRPYISTSQISQLIDQGFTFGGHSIDHARFPELPLEDQVTQARSSIDFLSEKFAIDYRVFAFPYSDHGVESSFFEEISDDIDASFGSHGLLEDPVKNHFQRISVEKYNQLAQKTIKFHYTRRIIKNYMRRSLVVR